MVKKKSSTQGRTGEKLPRINMAFYGDNLEYVRDAAYQTRQSVTEYINHLIAKDKERSCAPTEVHEQWEYKVEHLCHRGGEKQTRCSPSEELRYFWEIDLEKQLNKLGADGWEVVDFPNEILHGTCDGWALFKRKKHKEIDF